MPTRIRFQLNAGHSVLDFANTLDDRYGETGPVELLPSFDHLVSFCRQAKLITSRQAKRLTQQTAQRDAVRAWHSAIKLREAVYSLFRNVARDQPPSKAGIATLNRFLAETSVLAAVAWGRGAYAWRGPDPAETPRALLGLLSRAAAELLISEDRDNIRECGTETCRWLFLDRSKNHSRRWCDMKICGNRMKARKFHDRRKSPSTAARTR